MGERDHYLHGADDVRSAANTMSNAADSMRSAAGTMSDAADKIKSANWEHETFMSQWLERFEAAVERMPKAEAMNKPFYPGGPHKDICTPDRCHCGSQ